MPTLNVDRHALIAAATKRQLVAVHYVAGPDETTPAIVVGRVVKVSLRVAVVATESKQETVIPLEHIRSIDDFRTTSGDVSTPPEAA